MSNEQQARNIEQLWCVRPITKSTQAVQQEGAGAKEPYDLGVRGWSSGLAHLNQGLKLLPLLDYSPPETVAGTDFRAAPISLSFRKTKTEERIIINKTYIHNYESQGPAVSSHLLYVPPSHMTPQDAIRLWRSPFWRASDETAPNSVKDLPLLSVNELRKAATFRPNNDEEIRKDLPFVIQAYLLQRYAVEIGSKPSYILCIAAPADRVAHLIFALMRLLPQQLQEMATFSTYEHDALRKDPTCRIVGTDAFSARQQPNNYSGHTILLLDTFRSLQPELQEIPPTRNAASYAQYATNAFLEGNLGKLDLFFKEFKPVPEKVIASFLLHYDQNIKILTVGSSNVTLTPAPPKQEPKNENKGHLTKEEIVDLFQKRSNHGKRGSFLRQLEKPTIRKQIVERMVTDFSWFRQELSPHILSPKDEEGVDVMHVLRLLDEEIIKRVIEEARNANERLFRIAFDILLDLAPLEEHQSQWIELLDKLKSDSVALNFVWENWPVRELLLKIAQLVLVARDPADDELVEQLLIVHQVAEFPRLLASPDCNTLLLDSRWNYLAMKLFAEKTPEPFQIEPLVEQENLIKELVGQALLIIDTTNNWGDLQNFFTKLARNKYLYKLDLLSQMLAKRPDEKVVEMLLIAAQLTDQEVLNYFESRKQEDFLYCYVVPQTRAHYIRLVPSYPWLKPFLYRCLQAPEELPPQEIDSLIKASKLDLSEQAIAFERGGNKYLKKYLHLDALLSLAAAYYQREFGGGAPLTQARITTLARMISDLPEPIHPRLYHALAALEQHIDSTVRLGFIVATLSMQVGAKKTNELLYYMASRAHNDILPIMQTAQDADPIVCRFSAYLQFALCADDVHDLHRANQQQFSTCLLNLLLTSEQTSRAQQKELFTFINTKMAQYWPTDVQERWKQEEAQRNPVVDPPFDEGQGDSQPSLAFRLQARLQEMAKKEPELHGAFYKEKRAVLEEWKQVLRKNSIKEIAYFWIENRTTLSLIQGLRPEEWNMMVLAYNFYTACKKSEKQVILEIADMSKDMNNLLPFNWWEKWLIWRARKEVKK